MSVETSPPESIDVFKQLEEYDWDKDKEFQGGLGAILGPNPTPSQAEELTLRAQCFYFSRKKGISIDFDAYKTYLSSKQSSTSTDTTQTSPIPPSTSSLSSLTPQPNDILPSTAETNTSPNPPTETKTPEPPNQPSLETTPTPTPTTPMAHSTTTTTPSANQAPYPASFASIVALITSGQPIPGIIDVPNIVLRSQHDKTITRARRKPWEMHKTEDEVQGAKEGEGVWGDRRDVWIEQEMPEEDGVGKGDGNGEDKDLEEGRV